MKNKNKHKSNIWSYYVDGMFKLGWGTRGDIAIATQMIIFLWLCVVGFVLYSILPAVRPFIIISCSCGFLFAPFVVAGAVVYRYRESRKDEYFNQDG